MLNNSQEKPRPSMAVSALIGFAVGAGLPVAYGMYVLIEFHRYVDSLPPGDGVCGMPALLGYMLIFIGSPALGVLCGATAALCAGTWRWLSR